ncbi:zinc-ribbon domain-containing protein [Priestia megaterium]|uniref:zinc-ribbon domain-containing protein n=1 Tax=Priestia megaterium TaxID=1404 RepID=UPI00300AC45A
MTVRNYPYLSAQWHSEKNKELTPEDVTVMSNRKVWWICSEGHEWEAAVSGRTRGTGCPYCSGRKVTPSNSLEVLYSNLAAEWHPTKNGDLTPNDVT